MSSQPGHRVHLERALSKLGLLSRGEAARAIAAGEVQVNGRVEMRPKCWVDWRADAITYAGRGPVQAPPGQTPTLATPGRATEAMAPAATLADTGTKRYGVLHKPRGYVTTRRDELGRGQEVYALLPPEARGGWLFAVGRLDKDSEGLLLFTNDGPWSARLTGPDSHVPKIYRVKLNLRPKAEDLARFRQGLWLDGTLTLPCEAEPDGGSWVRVTLHEGRNRQIRRMFHALGYKVTRLIRVGIGTEPGIALDAGLAPGAFRWLTAEEVEGL